MHNGLAVNLPAITAMQKNTPTPMFMQPMFIFPDKHRLLQKIFTTQMPKYNVSINCQPDFYSEKPSVYGGRLEPLVMPPYHTFRLMNLSNAYTGLVFHYFSYTNDC
jgi:hypothetical protein